MALKKDGSMIITIALVPILRLEGRRAHSLALLRRHADQRRWAGSDDRQEADAVPGRHAALLDRLLLRLALRRLYSDRECGGRGRIDDHSPGGAGTGAGVQQLGLPDGADHRSVGGGSGVHGESGVGVLFCGDFGCVWWFSHGMDGDMKEYEGKDDEDKAS